MNELTNRKEKNYNILMKGDVKDMDEEKGMTNEQYKGLLLDELEDWQEVLELAEEGQNDQIRKKAEKQIAKIDMKLKF